jgi:putative pyruvate formate lyase activating enzyme
MCDHDKHDRVAFLTEPVPPTYLSPSVRENLPKRLEEARANAEACHACPRECGVDRTADIPGVCGVGRLARVSSSGAHTGEEDCLRGWAGSGTIFFAGCNLRCAFCQNWTISQKAGSGDEATPEEIADTMLQLQEQGCHNINLVTPEHVVPQVVESLCIAIDRGLTLPVVYNTSAYDSLDALKLMDGLVDIYMPDIKLVTPEASFLLLGAKDYGKRAREAVIEMHRQVGDLKLTSDGIAVKGLLVRHLVMPGLLEETKDILNWIAKEVSTDTYINIMGQYHPDHKISSGLKRARINREPPADAASSEAEKTGADGTGSSVLRARSHRLDLIAEQMTELDRRCTPDELAHAHEYAREAGLWRFAPR